MMKKKLVYCLLLLAVCSCSTEKKEAAAAQKQLETAQQLAQSGQFNACKTQLDSIHMLYPRQIAVRRAAEQLKDSISLVEAQRNQQYADSLLQLLLPEADKEVKRFVYEKNAAYEDHGRYVHRLLSTNRNTARCFLQTYLTDDFRVILKSYYYGERQLNQNAVALFCGDDYTQAEGSNHAFQAEGWHEILTVEEDDALNLLAFADTHAAERLKVVLHGTRDYTYYLTAEEKKALTETRRLAVLMKDVHQLEEMVNLSQRQIEHFSRK